MKRPYLRKYGKTEKSSFVNFALFAEIWSFCQAQFQLAVSVQVQLRTEISRVPTLIGKSTWDRNFSFFSNSGWKKVGILRKRGNFLKYLNSFLIMKQNDKIKLLFFILAPLFAWWIKIINKVGLALRNLTITLNVSTAYSSISNLE